MEAVVTKSAYTWLFLFLSYLERELRGFRLEDNAYLEKIVSLRKTLKETPREESVELTKIFKEADEIYQDLPNLIKNNPKLRTARFWLDNV